MYVYMSAYMWVCKKNTCNVNVCMHVCVRVCISVWPCLCLCVRACVRACMRVCVLACISVWLYVCAFVSSGVCMYHMLFVAIIKENVRVLIRASLLPKLVG